MKKNVLKIGVLSLFVAGALTATLTGSVNDVSALQKGNFDDGYANEILKPSDDKMLLADARRVKVRRKVKVKRKSAMM